MPNCLQFEVWLEIKSPVLILLMALKWRVDGGVVSESYSPGASVFKGELVFLESLPKTVFPGNFSFSVDFTKIEANLIVLHKFVYIVRSRWVNKLVVPRTDWKVFFSQSFSTCTPVGLGFEGTQRTLDAKCQ